MTRLTHDFAPVAYYADVDAARFATVKAAGAPAVLRGIAASWPSVRDPDTAALFARLKGLATNDLQHTLLGRPGAGGAFFYADDFGSQNYSSVAETVGAALDRLLSAPNADGTYIQSIPVSEYLPGFTDSHPMPFVPDGITGRAWIGNRTTVQTHFDPSDNIAVVVHGTRTVTLFPPDQLAGLYPGPLETAPGRTVVSTTRLDAPDFDAHPKFRDTLKTGLRAELGPGDGIYIPYGWWHHVRATAPLNMLVNYWWTETRPPIDAPWSAMMLAMMCFQGLSESQAAVWSQMFDHYVFRQNGDPMAHLPPDRRGMLGGIPPEQYANVVHELLGVLGPTIGLNPPPRG